jgi:hypothetical protein
MDLEAVMHHRRDEVAKTIRPITIEQLKALEEEILPYFEHPWREPLDKFIAENKGVPLYYASAGEGVQVVYCPSQDRGLWFIAKKGLGLLQSEGLKLMKEVVEKK